MARRAQLPGRHVPVHPAGGAVAVQLARGDGDGGVAGVRYPAGADHDHARVLAGELGERRGGARG